jgi:phi13 family phage major tail protein
MAYIGVRKPYVAKRTGVGAYGTLQVFGKATTFEEAPNVGEATLYGDDALAESERGVTSAALTLGTTDIPAAVFTEVFGHTQAQTGNEITSNIDDSAPYCGFAVIGVKKVDGVRKYEARVYPKTQWAEPTTTLTTRGENTEFQTPSVSGTAMAEDGGVWRYQQDFDTEAAAIEYIQTKLPAGA